jgi:hypothetical protein
VAALTCVFEPEVTVVTLRRALPRALSDEVFRLACAPWARRLFSLPATPNGADRARAELPELPHLAKDVWSWSEVLAELTGCERIGVRLSRVSSALCPRFHVDHVTVRLVCTYVGPGTEFISNGEVDRRWLGHAAQGVADEESGLLRCPQAIEAAAPGDLVLLKGEAWPEQFGKGAVHRSPPASELLPRLVMTLDPL